MADSVRYFLYDCDGPLFDTEGLKAESWGQGLCDVLRVPVTGLIAKAYRAGGTTAQAAERILARCRHQLADQITDLVASLTPEQLIVARNAAKERLFEDAFPASGRSKRATELLVQPVWEFAIRAKRHVRVGLVTTTQEYWVSRYLMASGVTDAHGRPIHRAEQFFEVVVYGKEKAEGIKEAVCRMLGRLPPQGSSPDVDIDGLFARVPPAERRQFVLFEDSLEGVQQAKAVGISVVAVPNEWTQDEPLATLADLVLRPADLHGLSPHALLAQLPR